MDIKNIKLEIDCEGECGKKVDWIIRDDEGMNPHMALTIQCGYCGLLNTKRPILKGDKPSNECQFCKNRFCYHQIYRLEEPYYDEVYCRKHIEDAEKEADRVLGSKGSKVFRTHRSSTGVLSRGKY